jgi:hypothetical protein
MSMFIRFLKVLMHYRLLKQPVLHVLNNMIQYLAAMFLVYDLIINGKKKTFLTI